MARHPSGWTPPELPDLPAGEAPRTWPAEVWGTAAQFPPPSAPGFQDARRMGILPAPAPDRPPTPVAGLTSWDRLRLVLLLVFGAFGLVIVVGKRLDLGVFAMLPLATAPFAAAVGVLLSTRRRDETEHAAGYTSSPTHTGLWRLARDGRVLREPDRSVPPPGWYPSPYYPGLLQRWDGPGWKPLPYRWWHNEGAYFRRPQVPFL